MILQSTVMSTVSDGNSVLYIHGFLEVDFSTTIYIQIFISYRIFVFLVIRLSQINQTVPTTIGPGLLCLAYSLL